MKKSPAAFFVAVFIGVVMLFTMAAGAQPTLPALETPVPDAVSHATREPMRCLTAEAHYDPCAPVTIANVHYVIAWDQDSHRVSYIFTADPAFRTQNNLAVGRQSRVLRSRLLPYKRWQIDAHDASSGWFPVVATLDSPGVVGQEDETDAVIIGFVQTVFLRQRVALP